MIHGYWSIDPEILHTTADDQLPAFRRPTPPCARGARGRDVETAPINHRTRGGQDRRSGAIASSRRSLGINGWADRLASGMMPPWVSCRPISVLRTAGTVLFGLRRRSRTRWPSDAATSCGTSSKRSVTTRGPGVGQSFASGRRPTLRSAKRRSRRDGSPPSTRSQGGPHALDGRDLRYPLPRRRRPRR
ncbi:MAG: hypothetical protein ACR2MB_14405 [Acidimicrobiales bacterium]